jgi:hypothetical protein
MTENLGKEGIRILEEVLNSSPPNNNYLHSFIPFHFIK